MSHVLTIRLRDDEIATLDKLRDSNLLGHLNRTEYIRYLIISEHQRRQNKGRARPGQYSSELRNGRQPQNRNTVSANPA